MSPLFREYTFSRTLLLSGFLSAQQTQCLRGSILNPAQCFSDAEVKLKWLLYLFPLLAKRVLLGREEELCSVLFGEGDSVDLYFGRGETRYI